MWGCCKAACWRSAILCLQSCSLTISVAFAHTTCAGNHAASRFASGFSSAGASHMLSSHAEGICSCKMEAVLPYQRCLGTCCGIFRERPTRHQVVISETAPTKRRRTRHTHTCLEGFKETGRSFFAFRARRTARCNCKSALPLTRISQPCLPALLEDLTPADPGLDLKVAFNGLCVRLNSSFSREDSKAADLMQED